VSFVHPVGAEVCWKRSLVPDGKTSAVPVTDGIVTKLPVPDANCNTPELSADWVSPLVVVAVMIEAII
jgi:hypothetical protein